MDIDNYYNNNNDKSFYSTMKTEIGVYKNSKKEKLLSHTVEYQSDSALHEQQPSTL